MDIEAWLVCGKNKLTVSTLVSILIRHRARTPRTWTDSLLASDDGPTNWLQHFVLINLSEVFFKHYLVQKGGSKSSHHHPTPPKTTFEPLLQVPLGNNKTCFGWGWVEGGQIVLFFKLYPVWQQYICMISTNIWLIACVKLQLTKGFYTPVWWLWWRQITQWHYQRSQWSKPSTDTKQVF